MVPWCPVLSKNIRVESWSVIVGRACTSILYIWSSVKNDCEISNIKMVKVQKSISFGGASCAAPDGPSERSSDCTRCIWKAWRPCVCGNAASVRPTGRSASRIPPSCSGTASHLKNKTKTYLALDDTKSIFNFSLKWPHETRMTLMNEISVMKPAAKTTSTYFNPQ